MLAATAALNDSMFHHIHHDTLTNEWLYFTLAKLSRVTVENELPKLLTEKGTFPINLLEKPISVTFTLLEKYCVP